MYNFLNTRIRADNIETPNYPLRSKASRIQGIIIFYRPVNGNL